MLTDGLEWCGLLWWFFQLFWLSFWRHPFTAEHPLRRDSGAMLHFSKSDEETNSSTDGLRASTFSANVYFWVNYSLEASCQSLDHRQFLNNKSVRYSPDEQHVSRRSSQRDDKGSDDRQSQEVGEDSMAAVSVVALACTGRMIPDSYTTALLEHLKHKHCTSDAS